MNPGEHIKRISELEDERESISLQIIEEAAQAFPIGTIITFHRGMYLAGAGGKILEIDACRWTELPKFKIQSHTGNKYWISLNLLIREFNRHGDIMFDAA
jgi:hypothetical protein